MSEVLPLPLPVKRACDACHKRKVACRFLPDSIEHGQKACITCISAGLSCTYDTVPQKKGPKGSRAKVITEIRETQRKSRSASVAPSLAPSTPERTIQSPLSPSVIQTCVDYFFANMYTSQPILQRAQLAGIIERMDTDLEAKCLVLTFCAYMLMQPNMIQQTDACGPHQMVAPPGLDGRSFFQEAISMRRNLNLVENPSELSILTSFFLGGVYHCQDNMKTPWFYLREATTLARWLGMHEEGFYKGLSPEDDSRMRCLYWLLFVAERIYAIGRHQTLSLYSTIERPSVSPEPTALHHLDGFITLINFYEPFDDRFFGLWNGVHTDCQKPWLLELQRTISNALVEKPTISSAQAINLYISQQWLRMITWQLAITHGQLSSSAIDPSLTFEYPIELARLVVNATATYSHSTMNVNGMAMVQKLFDIACALIDILAFVPIEKCAFDFGPCEYLVRLIKLISSLRGGASRFVPILIAKIDEALPCLKPYFAESGVPKSESPIRADSLCLVGFAEQEDMVMPQC